MKLTQKIAGVAAALMMTALAPAAFAQDAAKPAQEINFGIISTEASQNQKVNWVPFLEAMTKATGLKINAFYASDYAGVIEAMRFNKVQVAWHGNKSGMEAVDRADGEVFAQTIGKEGNLGYYSYLITNVDKPFTKLDDVLKCDKSLDFGIGDPNSTSGFLVPTTYIFAAKGIDPKACFKTVRNANHQANAMATANNQVDVATNNSDDLERLEKSNPDARKKIKIIWTSPIIPLDPIVWRKDLDAGAKAKIQNFILSYGRTGTPDEIVKAKEVLANLNWSPLKPSSNHQLVPIRKLELAKVKFKVEGDDKLTADDKKAQIAKIDADAAKLAALEAKLDKDPTIAKYLAFTKLDPVKDAAEIQKQIAEFNSGLAQMAY
jgi:phosphonate transport system substrate-binding protein